MSFFRIWKRRLISVLEDFDFLHYERLQTVEKRSLDQIDIIIDEAVPFAEESPIE
jgi:hypothetical protein